MKTSLFSKGSHWVAAASWISFFVLSWMLLARRIENDSMALFFVVFFFVVALFASSSFDG